MKSLYNVQITVKGIEYLQENEKMKKVWAQIKDVRGILFAAIQPFK
ncbi:YjcQ family protein [uncultured Dialister sp.]